jgi:hypothetical protein
MFAYHLHATYILGLFFNADAECGMFLRNIGWLSTNYTAIYDRIQNCPSN